jgi:hypothetical protein
MNAQARKDFERVDAELNKIYQSLLAKLADTEAKNKLRESQRAWLAFRDAEAAFATDQVRGGSAAPVLRWTSMTQTTEQRVKQLKADFPDNGDASNKTLQPTSAGAAGPSSPRYPRFRSNMRLAKTLSLLTEGSNLYQFVMKTRMGTCVSMFSPTKAL